MLSLQQTCRRYYQLRRFSNGVEQIALRNLAENFRRWGHLEAQLDPLGLFKRTPAPELHPNKFQALLQIQEEILIKNVVYLDKDSAKTMDIFNHLKKSYCGNIGAEFEHLLDSAEREWFAEKIENIDSIYQIVKSDQRNAMTLLLKSYSFETFLGKKFPSFKRYSGEGAESMLPAVDTILSCLSNNNIDEVVIGMPHRGRLSLLVSLLEYPLHQLFNKIQGNSEFPEKYYGVGDVTSHIATSIEKSYNNKNLHVSLVHNPSHLEAINSVVTGKVRAKQEDGSKAIGLLIHGDAAFSGQGCVPESFNLSRLPSFSTNGTIHLIVNNQIGFTTTIPNGRSSLYCSDNSKVVDVPILHVNGESLDDLLKVCHLACEYHKIFKKDIVIDLVTYRRYGHNEVDEPTFTQPLMYKTIKNKKPFPLEYSEFLQNKGIIKKEKIIQLTEKLEHHLDQEYKKAEKFIPQEIEAFQGKWKGFNQCSKEQEPEIISTGLNSELLIKIAQASVDIPKELRIHERLERTFVQTRKKMFKETGKEFVDWATAEAMAFGSLLYEGYNIRLSGQDSQRGTFSQRHAILVDQLTGESYCPLNLIRKFQGGADKKGKFTVVNSNLSELAVMAYEYGYSWENPKHLAIWEAQFGDFVNGAQVIIDQFIASSESKWMRQSGITLLLPHGYDGAGPDHSSGKLERFLQLCDCPANEPFPENNMIVVNPTTPANYFHLLRRQQLRSYRKPLIVMAPKTLLRAPEAISPLKDFTEGTSFCSVLSDEIAAINPDKIKRIIYCSGKIYYDLVKKRKEKKYMNTAIIRIEELAPFPSKEIKRITNEFPSAKEFFYVQEEPRNQGAWSYIQEHLQNCLNAQERITYIGREALPASAVGISTLHLAQVEKIFKESFP